jgi:hypothetical protein
MYIRQKQNSELYKKKLWTITSTTEEITMEGHVERMCEGSQIKKQTKLNSMV